MPPLKLADGSATISEAEIGDQQPAYQPDYKTVSVAQLSALLGVPLKLTTRNGRSVEGVLDSIETDRLQLRREVNKGVALMPVSLDSIVQLQAYY